MGPPVERPALMHWLCLSCLCSNRQRAALRRDICARRLQMPHRGFGLVERSAATAGSLPETFPPELVARVVRPAVNQTAAVPILLRAAMNWAGLANRREKRSS